MEQLDGKPKFYQPDQKDLEDQKRENIMSSIHQQEKNILLLLEKYKDLIPDPTILEPAKEKPSPKQTKNKSDKSKQQLSGRNRSITAEYEGQAHLFERFKLPTIAQSNKGKKVSKGVLQARQLQKKKKVIEGDLSKIYGGQSRTISVTNPSKKDKQIKSKFLQKRLKSREKRLEPPKKKQNSNVFDQSLTQDNERNRIDESGFPETELELNQKQIMKPIYYKKIQQSNIKGKDESESDNEGEVPLKFYERQWQKFYSEQCKEEMNFLYFSTTTEMKEWTQEILQLFEKHDEELAKMHKRHKFLEHFDENYFLAEIYKHKK